MEFGEWVEKVCKENKDNILETIIKIGEKIEKEIPIPEVLREYSPRGSDIIASIYLEKKLSGSYESFLCLRYELQRFYCTIYTYQNEKRFKDKSYIRRSNLEIKEDSALRITKVFICELKKLKEF